MNLGMVMPNHVYRSINEPKREWLGWDQMWKGSDKGLITCWERGREKATEDVELANSAQRGELPVLAWKGGVSRKMKGKKFGTLKYLAQWQGLRGEDLDIYTDEEIEVVCSKTGMLVTFTNDTKKFDENVDLSES